MHTFMLSLFTVAAAETNTYLWRANALVRSSLLFSVISFQAGKGLIRDAHFLKWVCRTFKHEHDFEFNVSAN